MNSFDCILNLKTFMEAIIIGLITFTIGKIFINFTIKKSNKDNYKDDYKNPYGLDLTFFMIGFFLHFIIEIIGINQWYCDKKCLAGFVNLSKL